MAMKLINLYGGPSAGKTVAAASTFAHLKTHKVNAELVGEFAKELIYSGNELQLVNQVYVMGSQYKKLKDLERNNIDIALSDSPLLLQMVYCKNKSYYNEIDSLTKKLNLEFNNINIFVTRKTPYQNYGRVHTEEESLKLDKEIWEYMEGNFHYIIDGNQLGVSFLADEVLKLADKDLLAKF
jgi:nicotinamide riboside kinase